MEAMLDPVSRALANAPPEDEEISAEEEQVHRLARFVAFDEGDVERLRGTDPPELRLRLADYRVRFYDQGDWIEILRIRHRRDAYR